VPIHLILLCITHSLQVLVLGCGIKVEQVPSDVAEYLARKNIKVEVLDSVGPQAADLRGPSMINPEMTLWTYYYPRWPPA